MVCNDIMAYKHVMYGCVVLIVVALTAYSRIEPGQAIHFVRSVWVILVELINVSLFETIQPSISKGDCTP